jgi:ParB family chromosome partitioning protein
VWIEPATSWRSPRPAYACVDPQTYGHRNRYGTGGVNKLPEEAKAERRQVIENNKAWRAAEPVRRDHIRTLLNAGKVPKGTLRFVTAEIMADPAEIGRGPDDLIAELAGVTAEATDTSLYRFGRTAGPALEAKATDARLPLVLLAQVAAAREQSMDVHTWRQTTASAEARWLTFLAGAGYPLSAIEQAVIDKVAAAGSPDDDETIVDESAPGEPSGEAAQLRAPHQRRERPAGTPGGPLSVRQHTDKQPRLRPCNSRRYENTIRRVIWMERFTIWSASTRPRRASSTCRTSCFRWSSV